MRCRLLAIDMDGTLLKEDGRIDPIDREAIVRARAAGLQVTLATGRLPAKTLPFAKELSLDLPLICADGAMSVFPGTGAVRTLSALTTAERKGLLQLSAVTGMPALFLTLEGVLGGIRHEVEASALADWSPRFEPLTELTDVLAPSKPIVAGFLMGTMAEVATVFELQRHGPIERQGLVDTFALPGTHTMRVRPSGVDKGTALAELAGSLGIDRAEVGAVGDWYNDLPMLSWAPWSFAMGQSPEPVARSARKKLVATAAKGGAIAEVIGELL